ncbi:hypothetical protein AFLA_007870 [Aspergillus flavus NRRL3357]|nr:hypothetical protein AFLA_007870 [Aspergillus flavus NRRL3357]
MSRVLRGEAQVTCVVNNVIEGRFDSFSDRHVGWGCWGVVLSESFTAGRYESLDRSMRLGWRETSQKYTETAWSDMEVPCPIRIQGNDYTLLLLAAPQLLGA